MSKTKNADGNVQIGQGSGSLTMIWRGKPGFPTLQHRGEMASPLDEWSRKIKDLNKEYKNKKNDEYFEKLAKMEWAGGLYLGKNKEGKLRPIWPAKCVKACLVEAAKTMRRGQDVKRALLIEENSFIQVPKMPDSLEGMYGNGKTQFVDQQIVTVNKSKVLRTRPAFYDWWIEVKVSYLTDVLSEADVLMFANAAGRLIGLSDGRPNYGRFDVEA